MTLRVDQLKNLTLPLNIRGTSWGHLIGGCPQVVSMYDILQSYFSSNSFTLHTNSTLSGNGTAASPLSIATQAATAGQVLTFNGTTWTPQNPVSSAQNLSYASGVISLSGSVSTINVSSFISTDTPNLISAGSDLNLKVSIFKDSTLDGNGTSGSPLKIGQQAATSGQVLSWNGTTWAPSTLSGTIPSGTALGQILYWNNSNWVTATLKKDVQIINSGSQLTLPFLPLTALPIDVYLNGVLKEDTVDYTISSNIITFSFNFATNDKVTTKYFT